MCVARSLRPLQKMRTLNSVNVVHLVFMFVILETFPVNTTLKAAQSRKVGLETLGIEPHTIGVEFSLDSRTSQPLVFMF